MSRVIVLSKIAAFVALLFFAIPAQADEIEPEPEPAPMAEPEPEPEREAEPEPAKDDDFARNGIYLGVDLTGGWYPEVKDDVEARIKPPPPVLEELYTNCIEPPNFPPCTGGSLEFDNPLGFGARVGYRFHPHLAAEVEFRWLSSTKVQHVWGRSASSETTLTLLRLETMTLTGNVKGYLLTGRIQPFLLVGAGLLHFDAKDNLNLGIIKSKGDSFAGRFGAGLDFYINQNIVVEAQGGYVLPIGGDADGLDYVLWSVGLQYRF